MSDDFTGNAGASDDRFDLRPVLEALIFAAETPLSEKQMVSIINETLGIEITGADTARAVEALNDEYELANRAFRIHTWSGGYRMATTTDFAPFIKALYNQQRVTKLSRSLLETLAILAYKQPATKPELDYVRGVDCDYALRRLLELEFVEISGRADSVGRPLLYRTTPEFMNKFGLGSLDELPTLRELEELLDDPAYSNERARMLFSEGLGFDAHGAGDESESAGSSVDETRAGPDIEGDGSVGSDDAIYFGGPNDTDDS